MQEANFIEGRLGRKLYARWGSIKVYATKAQAEQQAQKLKELGYKVHHTDMYPYVVVREKIISL